MDKLKMRSPNLTEGNIAKLVALFPNCVTESHDEEGELKRSIDFDQLRQELSGAIVEGPQERYHLDWPGKREALLTANAPIARTLRPCREESVDFDTTQNLFIEGDNLDALKLLQETYLGKVNTICIDPPYNTGKDFIYKDNFTADKEKYDIESGLRDEDGNKLIDEEKYKRNLTSNGRFHSDWLSMMYPRLKLARNLLKDDGVIFISIGSDELYNSIKLCNEVFGEDNRISICARLMKTGGNKGRFFSPNIEYVLVFAKNIEYTEKFRSAIDEKLIKKVYTQIESSGIKKGERYRSMGLYQSSLDARPNQRYFIEAPDGELLIPPGESMPLKKFEGERIKPINNSEGVWRWTYERYKAEKKAGNIEFKKTSNKVLINSEKKYSNWNVNTKIWLKDRQEDGQLPNDFIGKFENRHSAKELKDINIPFDFAKPTGLIKFFLEIIEYQENDIILDFFAGSSTTADAVMQINAEDGGNRKFIMVQLPEKCDEKSEAYKAGYLTIAEIGKERIRRAGKKITTEYTENAEKKKEDLFDSSSLSSVVPKLDIGFRVFKIDSSNMANVYYTPDAIDQPQIKLFTDNIKPDRTAEDLLFQVLLDWGVDLSLPVTKEIIADKEVSFVDGNALAACFVKNGGITEDFVKELAKRKPLRVVFRDAGFKDDSVKINIEQIFKLISPHTDVKTI